MGTFESYVRLFRGRGDAHGSWAGGCVRKPLTPDLFHRHLHSHDPAHWIGVYNVLGTRCSWGCIDIDTPSRGLALNLREALVHSRIPAWVERTTRGFHVWVFPHDGLVEAATMRRALTAACLAVDYSPKEVFPKQTSVTGGLGNYVRLPLNGALANPAPRDVRRFIHDGVTVADMDQHRATTPCLQELADTIELPQVVDVPVDIEQGLEVQWEVDRIGGRVQHLWRDGPAWNHDRSTALAQLAHCLAEAEAAPNTAYTILLSADQRWGKFHQRGETGLVNLRKIVSLAYACQESA